MTRWLRAVLLLVPALACRPAPSPKPAPAAPERGRLVERLGPALSAPEFWVMEGEQKRAALFAPAEERQLEVAAAPGSRLRFSLATLKGAPPRGKVALELEGDGRPLQSFEIPALRSRSWTSYSVPLGSPAPERLTFRLARVDAQGRTTGARKGKGKDAPAPRWIALGAPRIVAPIDPAQRKVLVWISVDTLRADHLGAYGYGRPTSPVVDRLMRDAALFENVFSAAPWTLPSLTSQFTSRYPSEHGNRIEENRRDPSQKTVFEALAESGFTVLGVSANHFVSPSFGTADGFDTLWETDKSADDVTRLALAALSHWDGGHLALFVHYMDPHAYYEPPGPFEKLFDAGYRGPIDGHNFEGMKHADAAALRHVVSLYDGEIAFADHEIGVLLEGLAARGLLQNAVIAFSADHGEEFQDHGGWTHKRTLYQELLHVPLALRLPGVAGRRVESVVSSIDIAPTLLEALGVPAPASFNGRSLLGLAAGHAAGERERSVFSETDHTRDGNPALALRRGRLKYVLTTAPGGGPAPRILREELYDLVSDPQEKKPLPARAGIEPLRQEMLAWVARARSGTHPGLASNLSDEQRERLRALGYLQ